MFGGPRQGSDLWGYFSDLRVTETILSNRTLLLLTRPPQVSDNQFHAYNWWFKTTKRGYFLTCENFFICFNLYPIAWSLQSNGLNIRWDLPFSTNKIKQVLLNKIELQPPTHYNKSWSKLVRGDTPTVWQMQEYCLCYFSTLLLQQHPTSLTAATTSHPQQLPLKE